MISATPPAGGASGKTASFHLLEAKIADVHAALKSGRITSSELVRHFLNRIEAYDKQGPQLNAIQTVNPHALQEAEQLDTAFKSSGLIGPLHGIPCLIKDQIETSDMSTSYGSLLFRDFVSRREATIVKKMKKAGAIILGKATTGEFASRYYGSLHGLTRNAYDPDRNPSGSSCGTGAGIAANFAVVGIGEDTGGSIRGPAAVNSLVGLRPTVPLVSRYGMLPMRPTRDTLGPITRSVEDAAILLDVIAGYDPNDPMTAYAVGQVPGSYTAFLGKDGLKGARIGVIREPMDSRTEPDSEDYRKVKAVIDPTIVDLKALGAAVVDPVTISGRKKLMKITKTNDFEQEAAMDKYLAEHPNAPAKTLKEIILSGKVVPYTANKLQRSVGKSVHDSGYLAVLLAAEELRQAVLKVMADHKLDALVYATFDHQPTVIPPDLLTNPKSKDKYSLGANRGLSSDIGFPAITVPAGFSSDALPVGIEFLGRPFAEGTLFKLTYAYEQAKHTRKPPAMTPPLQGEP